MEVELMNPRQIEQTARKKLEEMFGVSLPKRKLIVGYDSKNFPKIHEFDLVSDDRQIVGEITSTTRSFDRTLRNCIFLSKIKARRKILVLTDKRFYKSFTAKYEGILPSDVEVLLLNLNGTWLGHRARAGNDLRI
jgi:hypothetical protein